MFKARPVLVGERLDLRAWRATDAQSRNPLIVNVKGGGAAALYRYAGVFDRAARASARSFGPSAGPQTEFLSSKRSLRVEWYIVILIVIFVTLYQMFFR